MTGDRINNTVKYIEIIATEGMVPKRSIMAPEWIMNKVIRGEELSNDDLRYCVSMYWSEGQ